jgi:hypothetical protein
MQRAEAWRAEANVRRWGTGSPERRGVLAAGPHRSRDCGFLTRTRGDENWRPRAARRARRPDGGARQPAKAMDGFAGVLAARMAAPVSLRRPWMASQA